MFILKWDFGNNFGKKERSTHRIFRACWLRSFTSGQHACHDLKFLATSCWNECVSKKDRKGVSTVTFFCRLHAALLLQCCTVPLQSVARGTSRSIRTKCFSQFLSYRKAKGTVIKSGADQIGFVIFFSSSFHNIVSSTHYGPAKAQIKPGMGSCWHLCYSSVCVMAGVFVQPNHHVLPRGGRIFCCRWRPTQRKQAASCLWIRWWCATLHLTAPSVWWSSSAFLRGCTWSWGFAPTKSFWPILYHDCQLLTLFKSLPRQRQAFCDQLWQPSPGRVHDSPPE